MRRSLSVFFLMLFSMNAFAKKDCDNVDLKKILQNLAPKDDSFLTDPKLPYIYSFLTPEQKKLLERNAGKYVDLKNDPAPLSKKDQKIVQEARDKVEDDESGIGYRPRIQRIGLAHAYVTESEVRLFKPTGGTSKKDLIARNTYKIPSDDHDLLISNLTEIPDKKNRKKGLSELMFGEIYAAHPWIKRVKVEDLQMTNEKTIKDAVAEAQKKGKKLSCKDMIRLTAAYKKFAKFGFSKFSGEPDCPGDLKEINFVLSKE